MKHKRVVLVLSTMRSGSTLLKALLATAPDISDLPEINFRKFTTRERRQELAALAPERTLVLKRPAWFHEGRYYPGHPRGLADRRIVLVRDVYETVESLRRMVFHRATRWMRGVGNRFLVDTYWRRVTERLLALVEADKAGTHLVRYEDLIARPIDETACMFQFVGSRQSHGVDRYNPPTYPWKWGRDDGSTVIKTLKVQPLRPTDYTNTALLNVIQQSRQVGALRERLGYGALPST